MQITPTPPHQPPPDRRLIERLIGFLRTKPVAIEPVIIEPPPPFTEHPTEPIRPDKARFKRGTLSTSDLKNPYMFPEGSLLLMRAAGHKVLMENLHRDLVLGRESIGTRPFLPVRRVDLTYYAGYRSGMSRVHCLLRRTSNFRVQIVDMGSTNGTYVNRSHLMPFVPAYVADGDEIQLGQFSVRVYFIYP
ncbi:MAG: hypothetical protein BroJett018_26090 [Chloroflexota bacterium]|nr:MAG: hypothetical protein BroJett018_26090 [Chloroflexota bacterium]